MVRPLIWFFVIGAGVNALVDDGTGAYQSFLVPGVIGMTMLFGAMLVSLSVAYERESGIMRLLISAPVPHWWIVVAKILGAALVAVIQAAALMILLGLFGYISTDSSPWLVLALLGTALACATLGMLVAVFTSTLDNFAVMMNFVIFPVFFLSGALYPVQRLPEPLKIIASVNPFTHCVDLLKHTLLGEAGLGTDFGVGINAAVVVGFTVVAAAIACLRFSHESRAGLLGFLRGSGT